MHTLEHGYHLRMCLLPGEGGSRLKVQKLRDQSEKEGTELVRSWYGLSTLGYGLPGGGVENIGLK